jgi:hypothetical protein
VTWIRWFHSTPIYVALGSCVELYPTFENWTFGSESQRIIDLR